MIDSLPDTILDRSVVGGYTSVGYRIRSRTWQASDLQRLEGEVVVVFGATSGIGLAAAEGFARLGASVRLLVRSERGAQARAASSSGLRTAMSGSACATSAASSRCVDVPRALSRRSGSTCWSTTPA
jgi:short chain dehydrogenase